jgi:hypothetical protein
MRWLLGLRLWSHEWLLHAAVMLLLQAAGMQLLHALPLMLQQMLLTHVTSVGLQLLRLNVLLVLVSVLLWCGLTAAPLLQSPLCPAGACCASGGRWRASTEKPPDLVEVCGLLQRCWTVLL